MKARLKLLKVLIKKLLLSFRKHFKKFQKIFFKSFSVKIFKHKNYSSKFKHDLQHSNFPSKCHKSPKACNIPPFIIMLPIVMPVNFPHVPQQLPCKAFKHHELIVSQYRNQHQFSFSAIYLHTLDTYVKNSHVAIQH